MPRVLSRVYWMGLLSVSVAALLGSGCKSSSPPPPPAPLPVTTANLTANQAASLAHQGNWPAAVAQWERAAEQYRLLNNLPKLATALHNLGYAQQHMAQYDLAKENLTEAASLNKSLSLSNAWWSAQIALLQLEAEIGDQNMLAQRFADLEPQSSFLPDRILRGNFLNERALWERERGELAPATSSLRQAEELFQAANYGPGLASIHANRGEVLMAEKNYRAARQSWTRALNAFERLADAPGVTRALYGLGRTLVLEGKDLSTAADLLARAEKNYRALDRPVERRAALEMLRDTLLALGRTNELSRIQQTLSAFPATLPTNQLPARLDIMP